MTRLEFLDTLRRRLAGLPQAEIDELVGDYATHFADGMAAGRSEAEIAEALGDPMRLAPRVGCPTSPWQRRRRRRSIRLFARRARHGPPW